MKDNEADLEALALKRKAEYLICCVRGHVKGGPVLTSNPPWDTCIHCGVAFRYERVLRELDYTKPKDPGTGDPDQ